jgi:hypothetical protein
VFGFALPLLMNCITIHSMPEVFPNSADRWRVVCLLSGAQGNVVSGTAPGTVDSAVAVNPDGNVIEGPPDPQAQALDKEHAEMLLQVKPRLSSC